jgi:hypothetical protein
MHKFACFAWKLSEFFEKFLETLFPPFEAPLLTPDMISKPRAGIAQVGVAKETPSLRSIPDGCHCREIPFDAVKYL